MAKKTRNKQQKKNNIIILIMLGVCALFILLAFLLPRLESFKNKPKSSSIASSLPPSSVSLPIISSSVTLSISSSEPAPEPEPEPEPEPPQPIFSFTEEEITQLNTMLQEWIDTATPPEEFNLEEERIYGKQVALSFLDLESGTEYNFNEESKFFIASLNKAPYAMYLYQLAEKGGCSLEETFYVGIDSIAGSEENSGFLKTDPTLPRDITLREMISLMLRYSDTAALRIVLARYPAGEYASYAAELGLHYPEDIRNVTNGRVTASDAKVYTTAIYNYMQTGLYGAELKEDLINTRNLMIRSDFPVARKYGWDKEALHDMAVVYAEHPYVLSILTNKSAGTWTEQAMFAKISRTIEEMMTKKWQTYESELA